MKKKILFIGITMNCAGSEKSFLSFVSTLDMDKYEVDLLLAKKEGLFLDQLPRGVNVIEMERFGELFLLSGKNAAKNLFHTFVRKNPLFLFDILPYFLSIVLRPKKKAAIATQLWLHMMQKLDRVGRRYDVAVAYWGDRTMFYMIDKVSADKKITWLHFDYSFPKRENAIYLPYFEQCDAIVNVSSAVDEALKRELPSLSEKCLVIENINNPALIARMAADGTGFQDNFQGKRILTIGRIADQKGYDLAIPAFARLRRDGIPVRWYVLGGGDDDYVAYIKALVQKHSLEDDFLFLGTTSNPYPYLKECDIYAQPSRYEGKPIAVEEAKIMAKPILAANYLSAAEQLEQGALGEICDISEEGIYRALSRMLTDDPLCQAYAAALKSRDFSNQAEIEKFYRLL